MKINIYFLFNFNFVAKFSLRIKKIALFFPLNQNRTRKNYVKVQIQTETIFVF